VEENITENVEEALYTKEELASSAKFAEYKDAVRALLEDEKSYSVEEAEKIINDFMKRRV
jgi:hypothetical protein